jgi:hypothetical protein
MPTAASAALRAAIHDALIADATLTTMLGGPKIYDEPPRAAAFPYVTLGETRALQTANGINMAGPAPRAIVRGKGAVPIAKVAQQGSAGAIAAAGVAAAQQAHNSGFSLRVIAVIAVASIAAAIGAWLFWQWRQQRQQNRPV